MAWKDVCRVVDGAFIAMALNPHASIDELFDDNPIDPDFSSGTFNKWETKCKSAGNPNLSRCVIIIISYNYSMHGCKD